MTGLRNLNANGNANGNPSRRVRDYA